MNCLLQRARDNNLIQGIAVGSKVTVLHYFEYNFQCLRIAKQSSFVWHILRHTCHGEPTVLMEAAEAGDISLLYGCIQDYPKILNSIDDTPFVDTPLHIAASAGHAHFSLEMMRLKPSFGGKLNPQGLSPLDLALRRRAELSPVKDLQKNLTWTIRWLINLDKELIRVKGRESFTPLHYVAEKGDIDLLAEFLLACPESIMDRTIRDEIALHIAVKNSKLEACKVLLGWLRRSLNQKLLNSKDEKGNTVLDIAVSNSQTE
ncbi:unnamed protein product [Camellia sinensis]